MCGIAGIVEVRGGLPSTAVIQRMASSIAHRGPDDFGWHVAPGIAMANRRLSIIDLSSSGHQPMFSRDGAICLVLNGEIYNYRELAEELRAEGVVFDGSSDTEVILRSYEREGPTCITRFNGMFAIAVWEEKRKRFVAARDRLGVKPFYYWFDGTRLVFGSEVKALLQYPGVAAVPNEEAIREYLLFGHSLQHQTWYRGIVELPPGSMLILEDGRIRIEQYWELRYEVDHKRSYGSFTEELRALLEDAVRLHLRSDVPVGAHLSGGIDSSSIVALSTRLLGRPIHTFSAAFEGAAYDERPYIRIVSDCFRTHHHELTPAPDELPRLLPKLIWYLDEPVIGAAVLPMYRISQMVAASGVKVVNGGQGADELFGGYPPFFVSAARNIVESLSASARAPLREIASVPEYLLRGGAVNRLFRRRFAREGPSWLRLSGSVEAQAREQWTTAAEKGPSSPFEAMSYLSVKHYLPGLLHQEDRMSMAASVESRVPLLDYRVVEFSARVPSWYKVRNGVLKAILRDSMRGIVPAEILDRGDKKGYPVPTTEWFRGPLAAYLNDLLAGSIVASDFVDVAVARQMAGDHAAGKADHGSALWKILNLELWFRGVSTGWAGLDAAAA
jgi:asparagine synthase (glutamine-hydrolysing)